MMFTGGKVRGVFFGAPLISVTNGSMISVGLLKTNKQEDNEMELCSRGQRFLEDFPGIPANISL